MPRKSPIARSRRGMPSRRLDPQEQEAKPAKLLAEQGVQPVHDFDRFFDEVGAAWPSDENLDDFLTWLRRKRNCCSSVSRISI